MAKLSEIFDLQMGKTPARANSDYWEDGTNDWVSIADLSTYEKYVEGTKEQITNTAVQESGIKAVPPNTVIMSFKLSLGKTAITKKAVYTNEAIMAFIPNGRYEISPDYLFYLLSDLDWSKGTNRAVMGATLNKTTLGEIDVTIPAMDRQQYIAVVLDKVSSLISLRKQQLAKLDELVKARFVEMFGSEDNVKNWSCCTVADVADVYVGVVIKPTQYYADSGIPAFRSLNIGEMHVRNSNWIYFTQEGHQKNLKSVIQKNDVLVVRSGAPGTACVASEKYEGYNAVDIIIAHPDSSKINSSYLAMFTNMPHGMTQIQEKTGGAAQQHFNVSGYKALKIMLPPIEYQNEFDTFFGQVEKHRLTIQQSLDKLEVLKKALMQEYFG